MIEARRSVGRAAAAVRRASEDVARGAAAHGRSGAPHHRRAGGARRVDELPPFDAGVEREIIGIAQEALTNAVRHCPRPPHHGARRRGARRRLPAVGGRRWPRHCAASGAARGFGMTSMRERAERIGASLTIVTAPRAGTEVVLAWEPPSFSIPGVEPCPSLSVTAQARPARRRRACWSSTITRCCAPASPTSSTRSRISKWSPKRPTAARRSTRSRVSARRRR